MARAPITFNQVSPGQGGSYLMNNAAKQVQDSNLGSSINALVKQQQDINTAESIAGLKGVTNLLEFRNNKAAGKYDSSVLGAGNSIFGYNPTAIDTAVSAREAELKGLIPGQIEAEQIRIQQGREQNQQQSIAELTDIAAGFDNVSIGGGGRTLYDPQQVDANGQLVPYSPEQLANQAGFEEAKRNAGINLLTDTQAEEQLREYSRTIGADLSQQQGGTDSQRTQAAERNKLSATNKVGYDAHVARTELDRSTQQKLRDNTLANVQADNKIVFDKTEEERGISGTEIYSKLTNDYPDSSWRWDSLGGQSLKRHISDNYSEVEPWIVKEALSIAGEKPNGNWFFDEGVDTDTLKSSIASIQKQAKRDDVSRQNVRNAQEKHITDSRALSIQADQSNLNALSKYKGQQGIANIPGINKQMAAAIKKTIPKEQQEDVGKTIGDAVEKGVITPKQAEENLKKVSKNKPANKQKYITADEFSVTDAVKDIFNLKNTDPIPTTTNEDGRQYVNKEDFNFGDMVQDLIFGSNIPTPESNTAESTLTPYEKTTTEEESFVPTVYDDPGKKNPDGTPRKAIGYGYNLSPEELAANKITVDGTDYSLDQPLPEPVAQKLYKQDLNKRTEQLSNTWPGFEELDSLDQSVLAEISYNTGNPTPAGWPKLFKAFQLPSGKARTDAILKEIGRSAEIGGVRKSLTKREKALAKTYRKQRGHTS